MKKRLLIGFVFFKSGKSYAFWNHEFTFTSTDGDVITINKRTLIKINRIVKKKKCMII